MLRRMINYRDPIIHCLPPELLAIVASHLPDDKSLIIATHVCHLWRSTFLSSPRLWSRLTLENERRTLVFLERSGSAPLSVDLMRNRRPPKIAREPLKRIIDRLTTLWGADSSFLDEILAQSPPVLRTLNAVQSPDQLWNPPTRSLPSLRSLAITNIGRHLFHVPYLTNFLCKLTYHPRDTGNLENDLFDFFRSCPLLEVIFLSYGYSDTNIGSANNEASTEAVPLPHLRSFTHESRTNAVHVSLFNRLSLPPTCDVTFTTETWGRPLAEAPWDHRFPIPPEPSYLSHIKTAKTTADVQARPITLRTEFFSSKNRRISFSIKSHSSSFCSPLAVKNVLDFLESSGVIHSIEVLHFEQYPRRTSQGSRASDLVEQLQRFYKLKSLVFLKCSPALFLGNPSPPVVWCPSVETLEIHLPSPRYKCEPKEEDILERIREIAVSRQKHGTPLKAVTLSLRDANKFLRRCRKQMKDLNGCVGSVQVLESSI